MKRNLFGCLALLVAGLLFLCPIVFAQAVSSVVKANNQFAFELYSKYRSQEGNIFFSPYSISSAIAMAFEGARGKTAEEIQSVFHFSKDDALRRESFLRNILQEMGMPTAFTLGIDFGGGADFSGMTGKKDLNIDEVIHKAFVEVNEEGTEAAAATAVTIMKGASASVPQLSKIKVFKADHPFIFLIQDNQTGNILFLGRVSNPTEWMS